MLRYYLKIDHESVVPHISHLIRHRILIRLVEIYAVEKVSLKLIKKKN
jgi:hypothetical protein